MDKGFQALQENKIDKTTRNNTLLADLISKAMKGEHTVDVSKDAIHGADLLKVSERFTIRKQFCIESGQDYYKLYKEVFYIDNPHKYYAETVSQDIYRRIAEQHESGNKDWAKAVAEHYNISIVE